MTAVFALIAAIGWGTSDFAAGTATRRSSAISVVLMTHLVAAMCLVPVALTGGSPVPLDLAWGMAAGLAGAVGALLLYRGLASGSMAVVAPVTAVGAASIPALYGLARGDQITTLGMVGIATALGAIVMMSLTGSADPVNESATDPVIAPVIEAAPIANEPIANAALEASDEALVWRRPWLVPTLVGAAVVLAAATAATPVVAAIASGQALPPGGLVTLALTVATLAVTAAGVGVMWPVMRPPRRPAATPVVAASASLAASDAGELAEPKAARTRARRTGLLDALGSGIGFGMFFVALSHTSSNAGMWPLVSARLISVLLFVFAAGVTATALLPASGSRRSVAIAGVFDALAAITFLLASRSGDLAIAAVLSSLYPGVTVLLARLINNERCTRLQVVGIAVAAAAVSVLALA